VNVTPLFQIEPLTPEGDWERAGVINLEIVILSRDPRFVQLFYLCSIRKLREGLERRGFVFKD
jgi:hypothetical protein